MSSTLDLAALKHRFEASLNAFLSEYTSPSELYDPIHYIMKSGGKRVRPLLTLLSAQAVSGTHAQEETLLLPPLAEREGVGGEFTTDTAIHAAIAVELIHNFTLVHDDIMDRSELRRGHPTVHVKWNESAAILSGDVMIGLATRALVRSARHAKQPLTVIDAFSTGIIDVCDGQAMDLALMSRRSVTIEEYFDMISKKTAKLLEMSAVIGARIGGADDATTENLREFACGIGTAFQLQDDLLDLIGTEEFGKQRGGDVVEGKRTWLMLRAEALLTAKELSNVQVNEQQSADSDAMSAYNDLVGDFYAGNGLPPKRVADVIAMMHDLGVVNEARALIEQTTVSAFAHLHALPQSPARNMLEDLANNLVARRT